MPLDLTDDKSTLVQIMAWYRQATSHYLSQCWPRSMPPNGVTRPQWVKPWPHILIMRLINSDVFASTRKEAGNFFDLPFSDLSRYYPVLWTLHVWWSHRFKSNILGLSVWHTGNPDTDVNMVSSDITYINSLCRCWENVFTVLANQIVIINPWTKTQVGVTMKQGHRVSTGPLLTEP